MWTYLMMNLQKCRVITTVMITWEANRLYTENVT